MGKKAPRRNAYFFFMRDYKRLQESRGIKFDRGLADVSALASDEWRNLPQHEKDRYKQMADDYNKSEERERGLPAAALSKKKKAPQPNRALTIKEAKLRAEKQFIEDLVENMSPDELLHHVFHLIHVNIFCKTTDNEFVPAELAISKFSMKKGIINVYHRIFNPGKTPLGYTYEIKTHSEKTHRIPLDFVKATRGYLGVYKSITDFLLEGSADNKMPPLFTMFDEPFHNCSMSAVKFSLKRIWETCNVEDDEEEGELLEEEPYEKVFKVLSLPILFTHLNNRFASLLNDDKSKFFNTSEANLQLLSDIYEFEEEYACNFHQKIDNVRYCSQSYSVRWAQVVQEQCMKKVPEANEEEEEPMEVEIPESVREEKNIANAETEAPPIKTEIKKENVKNEKNASGVIKTEKDQSIKIEREQSQIKKERESEPTKIKIETPEKATEKNPSIAAVTVKEERNQPSSSAFPVPIPIKIENPDNRDTGRNRAPISVEQPQSSESGLPARIKIEKYDPGYDGDIKMEHLDIPFVQETAPRNVDVKDPRLRNVNSQPRDPRLNNTPEVRDPRLRPTDASPSHGFPLPMPIKSEFPESRFHSRDPRSSNSVNSRNFPSPIPIKTEFPMESTPQSRDPRNRSAQANSGFPLPMTIKVEKPGPSNSSSHLDNTDKFPMPMKTEFSIKTEKSTKTQLPNQITNYMPLPMTIKVERVQESVPNPSIVKIKQEPPSSYSYESQSSSSRKRTIQFVGSQNETYDKRPRSGDEIKPDLDCPPTPRREDFPEDIRIKTEPQDVYSASDMKHEEIDLGDWNQSSYEIGDGDKEEIIVKKEETIIKEEIITTDQNTDKQ